jgi:hypothetical protein
MSFLFCVDCQDSFNLDEVRKLGKRPLASASNLFAEQLSFFSLFRVWHPPKFHPSEE